MSAALLIIAGVQTATPAIIAYQGVKMALAALAILGTAGVIIGISSVVHWSMRKWLFK